MRIVAIKLKNYRVFEFLEMKDIPNLCVVIGANGTGKSALFDIFGFLRDALKNNIRQALQVRGGFHEVVTRGKETEDIEIELQFRMNILETERLVTYVLIVGQERGRAVVKREILRYKRGEYGVPCHFLDFKKGKGYVITNEENFEQTDEDLDSEELQLESSDILAIKGLGQFQRFKAASAFRYLIENWHVSDFHISDARGGKDVFYAEHLSPTGDNMAIVAQDLYQEHPAIFERILHRMKAMTLDTPLVDAPGGFVLRFTDRYISDGSVKMFAYLLLLFNPKPHPLLCVEEPERKIHPSLLCEMAEEFASYAHRGGQVFVSTHSPDFLNAIPLQSIFWLTKVQGTTQVLRAADSEILQGFIQEGNPPGYLWRQGWLEQ